MLIGYSQFFQPRDQVLLGPVTLHAVAMCAKQLQILDVVLTPTTSRDDVVHFKDAEREFTLAPVAPTLLLAEQDVLVLTVRHRHINVGTPRDVRPGRDKAIVEQAPH